VRKLPTPAPREVVGYTYVDARGGGKGVRMIMHDRKQAESAAGKAGQIAQPLIVANAGEISHD
jgi:hypothetical protein